jgi:hypothetical protein
MVAAPSSENISDLADYTMSKKILFFRNIKISRLSEHALAK